MSKIGLGISFFFTEASNLHTNLFIKLCSLLEGIYLSSTKKAQSQPLSARISRGRGPTFPFLCDVKSSFEAGAKRILVIYFFFKWRPHA